MYPSGARKNSQPKPSRRGSPKASAAHTTSATISIPAATQFSPGSEQVVDGESDGRPGRRDRQQTRVVAAGAVDLDEVAVPRIEPEHRPAVVTVSWRKAQDVAHETGHRVESLGLDAYE